MSSDRGRLGKAQAELLRALVAGGPVPAGFDEARVRASADALLRKRMRELERAWPALAQELIGAPQPDALAVMEEGTAQLAGYAIARERRRALGEAALRELCAFTLRVRIRKGALTPRRFGLAFAWRRSPARGLVALRTPWGERWLYFGKWGVRGPR